MPAKITVNMVEAIKVQFLKPIFEDDFPDKGMTAWLTDVTWDDKSGCYNLWFDFEEFEALNKKYFKADYYPNIHTKDIERETGRKLFTALEAGMYTPKYSVYFSVAGNSDSDDESFEKEILDYLLVCEK
jgi:hypothetical protein